MKNRFRYKTNKNVYNNKTHGENFMYAREDENSTFVINYLDKKESTEIKLNKIIRVRRNTNEINKIDWKKSN